MAVADEDGDALEFFSYDAWGRRRNDSTWTYDSTLTAEYTSRGYTDHEHMDETCLINMNGRVYDPLVGLFLSPDPMMQEPMNPLNHNRYSYVLNNPLKYTDPSGYWHTWARIEWEQEVTEMSRSGGGGGSPADRTTTWWDAYNKVDADDKPKTEVSEFIDDFEEAYNSEDPESNEVSMVIDMYSVTFDPKTGEIINTKYLYTKDLYTYEIYKEPAITANEEGGNQDILSIISSGIGLVGSEISNIDGTFRVAKSGKISLGYYSSGWTGNQYVTNTYSFMRIGSNLSKSMSLLSTGIAYYSLASGTQEPITYVDAGVGTIGLFAQGLSSYTGITIPGVGTFVGLYGLARISSNYFDNFYNLGQAHRQARLNRKRRKEINNWKNIYSE